MTTTTQSPPIAVSAATIAADLKAHGIQTYLSPAVIAQIENAGFCIDFDTLEVLPVDEESAQVENPWIAIRLSANQLFDR